MRLDSVEIIGFKSFCDKQELSFRGGVTGIVGPNGCGKSNISDAISWVLGEQSAKSLRGAAMEDVIFAGSQSRQPLGMAEVNLKVSGLNGSSPDGQPECVVTRRLYRNGESEYLMNGEVCRLRDIHELFMDTGLGSKAYSIIEQGKIGLILSSKPADRRALIEEAAGITKYRARRRQTALKLEAAQQNLLRVNDIVHEVEKQLESLRRQAGRARRYRVLTGEMKAVEQVLFGRRFLDVSERAQGLGARLANEKERESAASLALETEEAQAEVRRNVLYEGEARLEAARGRLNELTLAADRHQARSGYCKEQIAEAETRAAEARKETAELESRVDPLARHVGARREEESRLRVERDRAQQEAAGAEAAVQEAAAWQAGAESALEAARQTQVDLLGRLAALQNARDSVTGSAERAAADLLKLAGEAEELERERQRVAGLRDAARARGEAAGASLAQLVAERADAAARGAEAHAQAVGLAREVETLQSERDGLLGRLSSLEEIVASHAAFDEGVRALLARPEGLEVLGVVADSVEVDPADERAVEGFLGGHLQAVLVPDAAHALGGVRYLESSGAGRGTFLPVEPALAQEQARRLREVVSREAASGLLSDRIRVTGPHAAAVRASLPDAVVVGTLQEAVPLAARHRDVAFVTPAGETVRGPLVEGGRAVKGLLAPRREVREVGARLVEVDASLAELRRRHAEHSAASEAAADEARGVAERIHAAEKELVAIRHELATAEEEAARAERKGRVLDTERRLAEQERGTTAVRLAEIEHALQAAEAERGEGSGRLGGLVAAVAEARAATETAQARSADARTLLAALKERLAAAEAECRRLDEDVLELAGRVEATLARAADQDRRGHELRTELQESERLIGETLSIPGGGIDGKVCCLLHV
jgi:chromosome segregation protein